MSPQREGALRVLKTTNGYRLVIGEEETVVEEVDRFLSALETRGLSPLTVRAYAFDSLVLYRWLREEHRHQPELGLSPLPGPTWQIEVQAREHHQHCLDDQLFCRAPCTGLWGQ